MERQFEDRLLKIFEYFFSTNLRIPFRQQIEIRRIY